MNTHYYFFIHGKAEFKKCALVDAIGRDNYCRWKEIDKLFKVTDTLSATDLIIHIYADLERMNRNEILSKYILKHFGIDDIYIGAIYCINRGIDFDVHKGQFRAFIVDERRDRIYGYGPTVIMAIANLHYELSVSLEKTFIP